MFFTGDVHKSYRLPSRENVLKALKDIKEVCLWFQHKGGCEECYFSYQAECQLRRWKPCDMRLNETDDGWKAIMDL